MAVYLTSAVICICGVELLLRAPLHESLAALAHYAGRSGRVIRSPRISDHWKEKVLPTYSLKVAQNSLKLFAVFVAVFAVLYGLSLVLDVLFLTGQTTAGFLSTWTGILFATAVSTAYYYARRRLLSK